ncbi:MAG TPA: Gfo/Idh/MocA family oxidoreductase [Nitrospirota bacterium]|nr:Gfo/Idh/MocA family oxidoreductase [Nitrospirota bacterium]
MNFLVAGLGSMGKRRIRCLKALGYGAIGGLDVRSDRRTEVEEKYGIAVYADFQEALAAVKPDCLIISVPPDVHHLYMKLAIEHGLHFFVEASVVDTDLEEIRKKLRGRRIVAAPSATLLFHPAITQIAAVIRSGQLGKISNIMLHSGQYLPDWHTYEKVSDYYVSNPSTGGAREIVPFELTWVTKLFGFPRRVFGNVRKTIRIPGAESIDDTYNFLLDYDGFLATVTVDVVSRHATRRLLINGDRQQLVWDWDKNHISLFDPAVSRWTVLPYEMKQAEAGYNANIGENMYIDELRDFIDAVRGKKEFINSLEDDQRVLALLYAIERSDKAAASVEVAG